MMNDIDIVLQSFREMFNACFGTGIAIGFLLGLAVISVAEWTIDKIIDFICRKKEEMEKKDDVC